MKYCPYPTHLIPWTGRHFRFFKLELKNSDADTICNTEAVTRSKVGRDVILKECVISSADKYCEQLFGAPNFPPNTPFSKLVDSWKDSYPTSQSLWVETLCNQIMAGVMWKFPKPVISVLQGLSDSSWYAPILIRVRKIPSKKTMQFDIYFYKFALLQQQQTIEIKLPSDEQVQ